ncbi:hypothetical protein ACVWYH_010322 [Bradyrhizobium sp. GM24.11]
MQPELEIEKCVGKRVVILLVLHASSLPEKPARRSHPARHHRPHRDTHGLRAGLCRQGISRPRRAKPTPVFISGQKRSVFGIIKLELRRRSAIQPSSGTTEGHLGRCFLKGRAGDPANVVLSATSGTTSAASLLGSGNFLARSWAALANARLLNGLLFRELQLPCPFITEATLLLRRTAAISARVQRPHLSRMPYGASSRASALPLISNRHKQQRASVAAMNAAATSAGMTD